MSGQRAIRLAAANGRVAVVAHLLADPRVDPAAFDSFSVRTAAAGGHIATVELLLTDARVQPSARQNQALRLASRHGHLAIVKALLADPRGLAPFGSGLALRAACAGGHLEVVEFLLADSRVELQIFTTIQMAVASGSTAVVERLLADARFSLAGHVLVTVVGDAVRSRNVGMLHLLLRRAQDDDTRRLCARAALSAAAQRGDLQLFEAVERWMALNGIAAEGLAPEPGDSLLHQSVSGGNVAIFERAWAATPAAVRQRLLVPAGQLLFAVAAEAGHAAVLQRGLSIIAGPLAGSDVLAPRALLRACARGDLAVVDVLLLHAPLDLQVKPIHGIVGAHDRGLPEDRRLKVGSPVSRWPSPFVLVLAGLCVLVAVMMAVFDPGTARLHVGMPYVDLSSRSFMITMSLMNAVLVCCLLERPNAETNILQQALAEACFLGHADVVARLLADRRLTLSGSALIGPWLLSIAAERRHPSIVALLLVDARIARSISAKSAAASIRKAALAPPPGQLREYRGHAAYAMPPPLLKEGVDSAVATPSEVQWTAACTSGHEHDHHHDGAAQRVHAFHTAAARGDTASLRRLLADPLLDPQAPLRWITRFSEMPAGFSLRTMCEEVEDGDRDRLPQWPEAPARPSSQASAEGGHRRLLESTYFHIDRDCALTFAAAMSCAAGDPQASAVKLLLADPCWEPYQVSEALWHACRAGFAAAVEALLADPRAQLRTSSRWSNAEEHAVFLAAAQSGNPAVLELVLADAKLPRHGVDLAAAGRQIQEGVRSLVRWRPFYSNLAGPGDVFSVPAVLRACMASRPPYSLFLRNSVSAAGIGQQAWVRRQHVVLARARALEDSSEE